MQGDALTSKLKYFNNNINYREAQERQFSSYQN